MSEESGKAGESPAAQERAMIAKLILGIALAGLIVLGIAALGWAKVDERSEVARTLLNALLPLFGTWVGAVVAYYFSRENFETANKSVQALAKQAAEAGARLRTVPVREAMLPLAKMKLVRLTPEERTDLSKVPLKARLIDLLKGPVSRVPVLAKGDKAVYVIHESLLYRFGYERGIAATAEAPFDINAATLQDFVGHEGVEDMIAAMAFVAAGATLADAKAAMDGVANCKDVFVTANGNKDEAVVGWITSADLERYAEFAA